MCYIRDGRGKVVKVALPGVKPEEAKPKTIKVKAKGVIEGEKK